MFAAKMKSENSGLLDIFYSGESTENRSLKGKIIEARLYTPDEIVLVTAVSEELKPIYKWLIDASGDVSKKPEMFIECDDDPETEPKIKVLPHKEVEKEPTEKETAVSAVPAATG